MLGLLSLLMVITYLDRVCISVAGPRMQEALNIGPLGWSWVTGLFTLAYAVFEIPSGAMGDRIGPRRVLTRIVLWWSAFTSLTGMMTGFYPLLATRFFFGMGEAGAFLNASVAVARWFPAQERGRAFGTFLMASQLGGAPHSTCSEFWGSRGARSGTDGFAIPRRRRRPSVRRSGRKHAGWRSRRTMAFPGSSRFERRTCGP